MRYSHHTAARFGALFALAALCGLSSAQSGDKNGDKKPALKALPPTKAPPAAPKAMTVAPKPGVALTDKPALPAIKPQAKTLSPPAPPKVSAPAFKSGTAPLKPPSGIEAAAAPTAAAAPAPKSSVLSGKTLAQAAASAAAAEPAWRLPPAGAVTAAPAPASAPATAPIGKSTLADLSSVLQRHGFVGELKKDGRLGLPGSVLTNPARVGVLLGDLRTWQPPAGDYTVMQRRMPGTQDSETTAALDEMRAAGTLASVTAVDALANAEQRRSRQKQCSEASLQLDAQEANVRTIGATQRPEAIQGSRAFWEAVEKANKPAAQAYRAAAAAYARSCLDAQWQALTPAQRDDMKAVVGYLHLDGMAACMGARIAKDRFLTARHCLYRYDRNTGWERHAVQRVQVVLAGTNGPTAFAAQEIACQAPQPDMPCAALPPDNPLGADHLVLRLVPESPGSVLPPMPALQIDRAAPRQMLVVPGRSTWITGRALEPKDPVYVTTADIGGCMIATQRDGCLVNSCQSEAGFSGAPMFARRQIDRLVLVGVFLGSTAHNPYPQCQQPDRNFGAALPAPVVAALKR
jgi:hypothetical protein